MASLSSSELKKNIAAILKGADLSTLSSKKIRKMLEEKFQVDLTDRRTEIDGIVMAIVTEENEKDGTDDSKDGTDDSKDSSDDEDSKIDSSENSSDSEVEKGPPPKKVKPAAPKRNLKKNSKNDSKKDSCSDGSDNSDVDDEALARKLQEEERNSRSRAVKKMGVKKEKSKRNKKVEGQEKKPRKESTYTKKCALSADLATVMGSNEMARHDVVKKMWEIVRERNLFDPSNKQFAICDDQLQKVFGMRRVRLFGMMKYLKNHIKDQK